jgi:hypothetical protein
MLLKRTRLSERVSRFDALLRTSRIYVLLYHQSEVFAYNLRKTVTGALLTTGPDWYHGKSEERS